MSTDLKLRLHGIRNQSADLARPLAQRAVPAGRARWVIGSRPAAELPLEAFLVSLGAVAIGEIGDKTQLATVALGARYEALLSVALGTTLGMMVANVPVVLSGNALAERIPAKAMRIAASLTFIALGLIGLATALALA